MLRSPLGKMIMKRLVTSLVLLYTACVYASPAFADDEAELRKLLQETEDFLRDSPSVHDVPLSSIRPETESLESEQELGKEKALEDLKESVDEQIQREQTQE